MYATELELTAELYGHEASCRYFSAHEEHRNFYTAFSNASYKHYASFCQV